MVNIVGQQSYSAKEVVELIQSLSAEQPRIVVEPLDGKRNDVVFDALKLKESLLPTETELQTGLKAELEFVKGSSRATP